MMSTLRKEGLIFFGVGGKAAADEGAAVAAEAAGEWGC
jgi:hypothetical protein